MIYVYLLPIALAGCVSVPNIDTNDTVRITASKIGDNTFSLMPVLANVQHSSWWKEYHDEQLTRLIEKVLLNNSDLKIAQLNINKVEQLVNITKSEQYPTINAGATVQKQRLAAQGFTPPPYAGSTINFSQIGLSGGYNLDLFGKVSNAVASQELQKHSLKLQKQGIQLSLSVQTFKLYGYYQYLMMQEHLYHQQKETARNMLSLTEAKINNGIGIKEELLQIQNGVRNIDIALTNIDVNKQHTINALSQLAGSFDSSFIEKNSLIDSMPAPVNAVNSSVVVQRPDIQAYMVNIEAQKKQLQSLKADFYPSISISGEAGFQKIGFSSLLNSSNLFGTIAPSISLPIFDAGRIQSNYKISGIDLNIFVEQYNQAVINSYHDINSTIYAAKRNHEVLQDNKKLFENEKATYELQQTKYTLGKTSKYAVVSSHLNYLDKQNQLLASKFNYFNSNIDLINALGGAPQQ